MDKTVEWIPKVTKPDPRAPRLRTITVFAPVPEPALDELTERLRQLQERPSPFTTMPNTHFARLAVLPRNSVHPQPRPRGMRRSARLLDLLTHAGRAQRPDPPSLSYLVFSASYDADPGGQGHAGYLELLRVQLGRDADEIWGLCSDYPGRADPARFRTFFDDRSLPPAGYVFSASDQEPAVWQVKNALRLRQQVIGLAVDSEGLADDQLVKLFRQLFDDPTHPVGPGDDGTGGQLPLVPEAEPALFDPPAGSDRLTLTDQAPLSDPDLIDVQNLVTSGYPRHRVSRHLLLRITDPPAARRWLDRTADTIPTAGWAEQYVDRIGGPADDTLPEDPGTRAAAPEFAVHVALSYAGLVRLGLPEAELAGFSSEFRVGMAEREPGLTPGRGTSTWQAPFTPASPAVHLLVMFSAPDTEALDSWLMDHPELLPGEGNGLQMLSVLAGGRILDEQAGRDGKPGFREHFGFVDGLSQPRIHGVTAGRQTAELPAGEALLGYQDVDGDTAGAGLPTALARNGSYLVYRKLEQDVPAFHELTRQLAGRLTPGPNSRPAGDHTDPVELAAAKLMGRYRDGTPLTGPIPGLPGGAPEAGDPALIREGFGFQEHDAEGLRCPVGAHIRRANPRDSRPVDPDPEATIGGHEGLEQTLTLRHRMLRRGIPYGAPLPEQRRPGLAPDLIEAEPGNAPEHDEERGLLFIALVGDIRRQFEFVQAHWMSDGNAFRLGSDRDILSGAAVQDTKIVIQGDPPTFLAPPTPLVTCRGGEYFFLPGISGLKRIAQG
jgi:Dyp-type peroxidase family